jgi:flagellar biosynthesis/type III secretory pathway M-ring protein FliF/YscJ
VFAEIEFDSGPLQEKPLDQREQEDQDTTDIWMYAIALVIVFVIIRVAFKIIKKRMKPKKD